MRKFIALLAFLSFVFLLVGCVPGQTNITLVFETNGGNTLDNMVVSINDSNIVLPTPIREGYEFEGWFLEPDFNTQFSLASLLQSGDTITLYAKWSEVAETTYITVTFNSNGGTNVSEQTIPLGGQATLPTAPTKEGHTFGGWFSDIALTTAYVFTTALSENTTLHAKWDVILLAVTFYDDDQTTVLKTETVAYGSAATAPDNPTKVSTAQYNYVFNVWDKVFNNVTTDLNVYATYTQTVRTYTVTFYNDDQTTVLKTETVAYGSAATAPANPTKVSTAQYAYTFTAWDKAFDNITGDLSVYATYTQTVRTYTVTFYNDDQTTVLKTETVAYGSAATAPANPTKAATNLLVYAFDSWDKTFDNITGNLDVYATYQSSTRYYTVTFSYIFSGDTSEIVIDDLEFGDSILAPSMNLEEGYGFDGWYLNDSYLNLFDFNETVSKNITIYGRYIELLPGFTLISTLHETSPSNTVSIRGVIYYISVAGDGFLMRDDSGPIYVESSVDSLEIGDLVEVSGTLDKFDFADIHFLIASELSVADTNQEIPDPISLTLSEVSMIDFENWRFFGIDAIVSGLLVKDDDTFMLYDLFSDTNIIFESSVIPLVHNLDTLVGQRITVGGILIGLVNYEMIVILYNDYHESPADIVLSEQEQLDELIALAELYLDQSYFMSGEQLESDFLLAPPGYADVIITIETFGPNALLFDVDTLTFGIVEIETVIDVRLTASINLITETIEIQFILRPALSIESFYADESEDLLLVKAIILALGEPGQPSILIDDTGILMVQGDLVLDGLAVGDEILIAGHRFDTKEGFSIMVNPDVFMILTSDNDVLLYSSTITEFLEGDDNEFYMVKGILIHKGDWNSPSIVADEFGMMMVFSGIDALVGDEILILGLRFAMIDEYSPFDFVFMVGAPKVYLVDIISSNNMEFLSTFKSISEVINSEPGSLNIVKGIVTYAGSKDEPTFIVDDTDILIVFGTIDAEVGDEVLLLGIYFNMDSLHVLIGIPNPILLGVLSDDNDMPLTATPYTFAELALIDPATIDKAIYVEVTGILSEGDFMDNGFILAADVDQYIFVMGLENSIDTLYAAIGLNVTLRGYLVSQYDEYDDVYHMFIGFVNFEGDLTIPELDTTEKITLISNYLTSLNLGELSVYDFLDMPDTHPLFNIPITWTATGDTANYITIDGQLINIFEETSLYFTVSFTVDDILTEIDLEYVAYPETLPFEPGYLGAVPYVDDTSGENFFPGLYIETIARQPYYEDQTKSYADLVFPYPSDIGATHYTIEYYDTVSEQWLTLLNDSEEPVHAQWYSYRVYFEYAVSIRLRAHGDVIGSDFLSNVVYYEPSLIDTYVAGWYLDESFEFGTAIAPYVGRGLQADATIYEIGGVEVSEFVTYQWYRVNPYTFEMIAIDGATDQVYVTTLADVGYYIMARISGDGINVGGYVQLLSYWETIIPVQFHLTGFSNDGFTLHLSHLVDINDLDDLIIMLDYYDYVFDEWIYEELDVILITQLDSAASYYISVDLSSVIDYSGLFIYLYREYGAIYTWDFAFDMDGGFFG